MHYQSVNENATKRSHQCENHCYSLLSTQMLHNNSKQLNLTIHAHTVKINVMLKNQSEVCDTHVCYIIYLTWLVINVKVYLSRWENAVIRFWSEAEPNSKS